MFQRIDKLKEAGRCPTCYHNEVTPVYPSNEDRTFYEDDLVQCFLELYPRNLGHAILLVKPHYDDFSHVPLEIAARIMPLLVRVTNAMKDVLSAEKVYLNTMCDGHANDLHFQLIPRYASDTIKGSKLFVKERKLLATVDASILASLAKAMK